MPLLLFLAPPTAHGHTTVEVALKGKYIPNADGYIKGISRWNAKLIVISGLVHLRKNHIKDQYSCFVEIMNISQTPCLFEAKHIFVTEEDVQNTYIQALEKRPIGESFQELSKKLSQPNSQTSRMDYSQYLIPTQEDCHLSPNDMRSQLRNEKEGGKEFSQEVSICALCSLQNMFVQDGTTTSQRKEKGEDSLKKYENFIKKTDLHNSEISTEQTLQLCKLFEEF